MKYKHKITGHVATLTSSGKNYKVTHPQNYTIPSWIIENSNDWGEIIEELFTLPEKWCVKNECTEEYQCLIDYANKFGVLPPYFLKQNLYFHFPNKYFTTSYNIEKGYKEITLEQFKKYVLKEKPKKDYEILTVIYKNSLVVPVINNNVEYCHNIVGYTVISLEDALLEGWKIHSIKRLSDDFIITLGDFCKPKNGISGKVSVIEFCGNGELRIGSDKKYYVGINDIEKSDVLFISEDEVEIREGDECYSVSGNLILIHVSKATKRDNILDCKLFSSKEKAEEFIIMNRPCLSINDIKAERVKGGDTIERLKQLVKSKL